MVLPGVLRRAIVAIALLGLAPALPAQQTLFDDTRLSSVYITLPADSLAVLYDSVLSDHYYLARFVFDDTERRDTLEQAGFRLRGNSSRYAKKKSFKISFNTYVPGRKYQGVKKFNLNGEHNDPTMVREKLFYDLWNQTGLTPRRTAFVRVYINQVYYGLYTMLEEMDKDWLGRAYPDKNGNLYKCTYPANLAWLGPDQQPYKDLENQTATGGRVYELQTNESQDDYAGLVGLIGVLAQPATGAFPDNIRAVLKVDRFLKALALDVATGNWDDYSYNRNNYYLYHDPADGRFDFITYDPDNTFGVDWFGIDWGRRDCRHWINTQIYLPLAQKLLAVPEFYETYLRSLDTIARTIIHPDTVFPRIDGMAQLIREAAVADTFRTLDYGYTVNDFEQSFTQPTDDHTPYGLKPFFTVRQQTMLEQLHPEGIENGIPGGRTLPVYPNPAGGTITLVPEHPVLLPGTVEVTDPAGKRYLLRQEQPGKPVYGTGHLPAGLYFIRLRSEGSWYVTPFIKSGL